VGVNLTESAVLEESLFRLKEFGKILNDFQTEFLLVRNVKRAIIVEIILLVSLFDVKIRIQNNF